MSANAEGRSGGGNDQHGEEEESRENVQGSRRMSSNKGSDKNNDQESGKDNNEDKDIKDKSDDRDQKSGGKNNNGEKASGEGDEHHEMSPRKKKILIIVAVIIGAIAIIGGILYWLHARHYEVTDDAFIDGHISQVSPRVGGQVQSLLIDDNQQVQAGQLLLEIDPRDYEEHLYQVEAQHVQALAQLAAAQANEAQTEANVGVAEADAFQARRNLDKFQAVDPKAITRQQLDNAIAAARSADAKLEASRRSVDAAKAQIGTAQANVQVAEVAISNAKLQLSYTKITAPIDGRITRRTVEVGNVVAPGQPLLAVVSDDLWVTANYKETQLDHMRVGQKVRIEIDAFPEAVLWGHIDSFQKGTGSIFSTLPAENATGNYVKVVQRIPVKIVFDDPKERDKYPLAPGLSVDPRVKVR